MQLAAMQGRPYLEPVEADAVLATGHQAALLIGAEFNSFHIVLCHMAGQHLSLHAAMLSAAHS